MKAAGPSLVQFVSYDILSTTTTTLQSFNIGSEFYGHYLPFFYQYELSMTFFSPDSKQFVYCDFSAGVWVSDIDGTKATKIAEDGLFAVWSPI
jgi:hypothetical protein